MAKADPLRTALLVPVFLSLVLLVAAVGCDDAPGTGGDRRQVVLYTSVDQEVAEPIIAEFERLTGIDVLTRFDTEASKTTGLVAKLRQEAAKPAADVFWSSEVFHTIRLAREGVLAPSDGPSAEGWPAPLTGREGRWHGFALRGRVIVYNTQRVSADEAPRRLEDLLDPKWKGRIVMAEPEFGTTGGDVASWFVHYGDERAREILAGLRANQVRLVQGNSTVVRQVASGQADVGFTDTDDVYARQRDGEPVAMHALDQGGEGTLAIPNTAGLVAGGPNPEAAKELLAFLLSPQVERMLAQGDSHNTAVHPELAELSRQYAIPAVLQIDYERVADELPRAVELAGEALR